MKAASLAGAFAAVSVPPCSVTRCSNASCVPGMRRGVRKCVHSNDVGAALMPQAVLNVCATDCVTRGCEDGMFPVMMCRDQQR